MITFFFCQKIITSALLSLRSKFSYKKLYKKGSLGNKKKPETAKDLGKFLGYLFTLKIIKLSNN